MFSQNALLCELVRCLKMKSTTQKDRTQEDACLYCLLLHSAFMFKDVFRLVSRVTLCHGTIGECFRKLVQNKVQLLEHYFSGISFTFYTFETIMQNCEIYESRAFCTLCCTLVIKCYLLAILH